MATVAKVGDAYVLTTLPNEQDMLLVPQKDGSTQIQFPGSKQPTAVLPKGQILEISPETHVTHINVNMPKGVKHLPRVRFDKANIKISTNMAIASGSRYSPSMPIPPEDIVQPIAIGNVMTVPSYVLTMQDGEVTLTFANPKNIGRDGKVNQSADAVEPGLIRIEKQTNTDIQMPVSPGYKPTVGLNLPNPNDPAFSQSPAGRKNMHVSGGEGEAIKDLTTRLNNAGPNLLKARQEAKIGEKRRFGMPDTATAPADMTFKPLDPASIREVEPGSRPAPDAEPEKGARRTTRPETGIPNPGRGGMPNNREVGAPNPGRGGMPNNGRVGSLNLGGTGIPGGRGNQQRPGADQQRAGTGRGTTKPEATPPANEQEAPPSPAIQAELKQLTPLLDQTGREMIPALKEIGKNPGGTMPSSWYNKAPVLLPREKPSVILVNTENKADTFNVTQKEMRDLMKLVRMDLRTSPEGMEKRKADYEAKPANHGKPYPEQNNAVPLASPNLLGKGGLKDSVNKFWADVLKESSETKTPVKEVYEAKKKELIEKVKTQMEGKVLEPGDTKNDMHFDLYKNGVLVGMGDPSEMDELAAALANATDKPMGAGGRNPVTDREIGPPLNKTPGDFPPEYAQLVDAGNKMPVSRTSNATPAVPRAPGKGGPNMA